MYVRAPKNSASLSKNTSLSASPPCANTSTPSASAAVYEAVPADGVCLFQTVPHLKRAFRARSTGRLGWTFWRETPETGRRRKRSEEHTSELQSRLHLVCRLLLEKKKKKKIKNHILYIKNKHKQTLRHISDTHTSTMIHARSMKH